MTSPFSRYLDSSAPRVLIVDDDPLIRRLVRMHLPRSFRISECGNAEETLRLCATERFDAALIDVEMPGMNGFDLCRRIKEDSLFADMPIVMVTARGDIEDIEKGFEAGATDYVRKPFNPRELVIRVQNAVELKRRGDAIRNWSRLVREDLALAGALQRSMLAPQSLLREDIRIHAAYRPSTEVGGDFFDIIDLPRDRIAFYVGDVSGHGVGAALAATLLRASCRELIRGYAAEGPAHIANRLHQQFLDQFRAPSMYATMFLAIQESSSRSWRCLNCGHPPASAIMPSAGAATSAAPLCVAPIGFALLGPQPYSREDEFMLNMRENSALILVTDGMLEAPAQTANAVTTRELLNALAERWLRERRGFPPDFVFDEMKKAGFLLDQDDCTVMLVEAPVSGNRIFSEGIVLSPDSLTILANSMDRALQQAGVPSDFAWAAHLVLVEHGANVMKHGRVENDMSLFVGVRVLEQSIELFIRDNGRPWRYEEAGDPKEAAPDATSGRGIYMIRRIASSIMSCRDGMHNCNVFYVPTDWSLSP